MPQHDAFFDTLEMDLQLQQRVQDEQLEEELLATGRGRGSGSSFRFSWHLP